MGAVHAFIAEVLSNFIDTLESTHNQTFQIKLSGDAHVHVDVQRVEVGDERTGARTAGDGLKGRGLHLCVAILIENLSQCADHSGAFQENVLHAFVHNQIDVALTVTQLWVIE